MVRLRKLERSYSWNQILKGWILKTRLCNSEDEPIDGTEAAKTVIYNADLLTEDKLNEPHHKWLVHL